MGFGLWGFRVLVWSFDEVFGFRAKGVREGERGLGFRVQGFGFGAKGRVFGGGRRRFQGLRAWGIFGWF